MNEIDMKVLLTAIKFSTVSIMNMLDACQFMDSKEERETIREIYIDTMVKVIGAQK